MRWMPTSFARSLGPRETVGVAEADLDRDGRVDVVFANQLDASLSLYWGDGSARLGVPDTLDVGRVSAAPAIGDMDGDGRPDLLVPDADRSELRVFQQGEPRKFVEVSSFTHPDLSPLGPPALLYWDGDKVLDVLVVAEQGVKVRLGLGGGHFRDEQIEIARAPMPYAVITGGPGSDAVLFGTPMASLVAAGKGGVVRRIASWPTLAGRPLSLGRAAYLHLGPKIARLFPDGTACDFGETDATLHQLTDRDGDTLPEGLSFLTCTGCTSNHVVYSGG